MDVTSLGFRTDLMLRALEGSEVADHPGYVTVRTPANPEFWWGNFLLLPPRAARNEAGRWLSLFRAEFPAVAHVALGIDITDDADADLAGFVAAGLDVQRETVMTAPALREPVRRHRAAALRPLAGDEDWRQSARLRAVCYGEPGPPASRAFTEARNAAQRGLAEAGHGAWFGAFFGHELVSQLGVFSDGTGIARYQDVATHPDARRQGLASALLWHAARYATDHLGATTLVIVADPAEPAIWVYRSAGFADRETQVSMQSAPSQI